MHTLIIIICFIGSFLIISLNHIQLAPISPTSNKCCVNSRQIRKCCTVYNQSTLAVYGNNCLQSRFIKRDSFKCRMKHEVNYEDVATQTKIESLETKNYLKHLSNTQDLSII